MSLSGSSSTQLKRHTLATISQSELCMLLVSHLECPCHPNPNEVGIRTQMGHPQKCDQTAMKNFTQLTSGLVFEHMCRSFWFLFLLMQLIAGKKVIFMQKTHCGMCKRLTSKGINGSTTQIISMCHFSNKTHCNKHNNIPNNPLHVPSTKLALS